ncbi:MAG TPA: hypothetical protein VLJ83_06500 [Gemmatimonadaceae bacterium]|nr:hypothetical protein [Gemmatimonadaceae bacterium]
MALLLAASCGFSPLSHHITVGEEPFLIFVGEGIDQHTDLFAVGSGGGTVFQVTFTPLIEQHPRLTPNGNVVAFLRMRDTLPSTHHDVALMDLVTGGDAVLTLPPGSGQPSDLAWSADGSRLYIRTDRGIWQTPAPPAVAVVSPVTEHDRSAADSALDLWLGRPAFALVVDCHDGGLCIIGPQHDTTALAPKGRDALRWGDDSVGWFEDGAIVVRSLGPGRLRRVLWHDPPRNPRDASYTPGAPPSAQ